MIEQTAFGNVSPKFYCEKCGRPLRNPVSVKIGMGPICRGHTHSGNEGKPEITSVDWSAWGERFDYHGYYGGEAHCLILRNGNTVVCTQPWDNPGLSVTNGAEDIATEICYRYGIPMDQLVWIEHYVHKEGPKLEHNFDRVIFANISEEPHLLRKDGRSHFRQPDWTYLEPAAAEALFGRPFGEAVS